MGGGGGGGQGGGFFVSHLIFAPSPFAIQKDAPFMDPCIKVHVMK